MSDLNPAEMELLVAVKLICMTRGRADAVAFEDYRRHPFTIVTTDWTEALVSLVEKALLVHDDHCYTLSDSGRTEADLAHAAMLNRARHGCN